MKLKVIDVSTYQGTIDWDQVKASGIDAAIIRCGYGNDTKRQDDTQFARNLSECKRVGMKTGVYIYSYAIDTVHAASEAAHVLRLLNGCSLDFPVFYDLEDAKTTGTCNAKAIGNIAEAFCKIISDAGYQVGIYANKYWFTSILTDSRFDKWDKWVAQYNNECTYTGRYVAWQYTSRGSVPGIKGYVDMSEFYKDYETVKAVEVVQVDLPDITGYVGTSIAAALNSKGYDSSFAYRATIAEKLGIENYTGTAEQNLNMIKRLGGSLVVPAETKKETTYVVKSGDTLSAIAMTYKTTARDLAQYNHIANANRIYVGQTIKIPN